MVRNYQRKSDRQNWSVDAMKSAMEQILSEAMGYKKAAQTYMVPQSTLEDRIKKMKKNGLSLDEASSKGMGKYKCVFSKEQEIELVGYVQLMESRLFGLTTTELRRVAYQLAERNQLSHNFNRDNQIAGLDWLKGFLKRHHNLSLRSPEPTSAARAMGFNRVAVGKFFDLLISLTDKYKFRPSRMYNVDETGLTTVPKSHSKVIAMRGRRQVGTLASGERGQLITAVLCFSAAGHYVPPFLIFPRLRMKAELLDGAPTETTAACHPSGWMQATIFVEWMQHFIKHIKPTKDDPVLLLLDGHATHTKNISLIDLARQNGVILLCFPPHCTHKLQPLDVSFMAPLSTFYSQEVKTWLRTNPGRVVTQYQIGALFGKAYNKAATIQTAESGFRQTGIYPTDRYRFGEADFAPAETTERDEQMEGTIPEIIPDIETLAETVPETIPKTLSTSPVAGPSGISVNKHTIGLDRQVTPERDIPNTQLPPRTIKPSKFYCQSSPSTFTVSPMAVMEVPRGNRKITTKGRVRGKTAILTESPYKNELAEMLAARNKSTKSQNVKRKITETSNKNKRKKGIAETTLESETEEEDSQDEDDALCIYCKERYSATKRSDGWIKCCNTTCHNWAHEGCTKWPEDDMDDFVCTICESKR